MPEAVPAGAAVASKIVSRRPHKSAEAPVAAGARDTKGRFVSGAAVGAGGRAASGEAGGGEDRLSSVADRLSQAVGGLENVGEADPAVRAMQEIADPVSRAYGALRGDKDAAARIAEMYNRGRNGVSVNAQRGEQWQRYSALLGNAIACYALYGSLAEKGDPDAEFFGPEALRLGYNPPKGLCGSRKSEKC